MKNANEIWIDFRNRVDKKMMIGNYNYPVDFEKFVLTFIENFYGYDAFLSFHKIPFISIACDDKEEREKFLCFAKEFKLDLYKINSIISKHMDSVEGNYA
jgi:hypothetical protein